MFFSALRVDMPFPTYLLLLIAFLFPLFGYLLILGLINRRRTPLMVPGTWDFVGLLFGMSGFILAGIWYLLSRLGDISRSFSVDSRLLWVLALACILFIVLSVFVVLAQRRTCTLIYNVDPPVFDRVLGHVLENKGLQWSRSGNQFVIQTAGAQPAVDYAITEAMPAEPIRHEVTVKGLSGPGLASLTLSPSRLGHCVAMRWECFTDQADQAIRREVERGLENELAIQVTEDNPLAGWLLSLSLLMFTVVLTLVVMLVLIAITRQEI